MVPVPVVPVFHFNINTALANSTNTDRIINVRFLPLLAIPILAFFTDLTEPAPARVHVIPIVDEINYAQRAFVMRTAANAKEHGASYVIFEIDTPGGEVLSTLAISDDILSLKHAGIKTIAYIKPSSSQYRAGTAWSAGALIAMSCQRIYMAPATVIGAAQPVMIGPEGPKTVEGKYVSALKAKFAAVAKDNNYPENLAIAMVDPNWKVYKVSVNGQLKFLTEGELEEEKKTGAEISYSEIPITKEGEPLTLTVDTAQSYGLAKRASSHSDIFADYSIQDPQIIEEKFTWSEDLVGFITSPIISTLLLLVGLLLLYIEFKTPGFGVAGVLGILCIALLIFGHHLAGLAQVTEIILICIGFILIALEIFVMPGVLVFGITGGIFVLAGLILSLQGFVIPDLQNPIQLDAFIMATVRIITVFAISAILFVASLKYLPNIPVLNRLVLQTGLSDQQSSSISFDLKYQGLIKRVGIAITPLHPGGKIEVDGGIYDVITDGEFVEKGNKVVVVNVEGNRIIVEKVKR